ncbi:small ribosomal subunit protein mS23 [Halyomorpha halys]|uniref:small ribosomal subunit protein mS23 n=1 Tax=Halyomorpha halys TaxID=286706 RepID=UPI0006D513EC|nr:probable 28S ribosomal protein S23, mitochondrial [Halyomorpha halys]
MAHSRLEKIGTIYTRVTGLIRAGSMSLEDRPLWYEVYQAFPPKYPPRFDRPAPEGPIRNIFYPEDVIRAKFYKSVKNLPSVNLSDASRPSLCQKCIALCTKLQKENNLGLDEAFDQALDTILAETETKSDSKKESEKTGSEIKSTIETVN